MRLGGIAFDTNRLSKVTQRRLCAAWMEQWGMKVHVVPQVAWEITGKMLDTSLPIDAAIDKMQAEYQKNTSSNNQATMNEIKGWKMRLWWGRELMDKKSPYKYMTFDGYMKDKAQKIAENLPKTAFPRTLPSRVSMDADALIISQAFASGNSLFITGNMNSIFHHEINRWVQEEGVRYDIPATSRLADQDEEMVRAFATMPERRQLLEIVMGAFWPDAADADADSVQASMDTGMAKLCAADMVQTSEVCVSTWINIADPDAFIERVRSRLPADLRASERRHPFYVMDAGGRQKLS